MNDSSPAIEATGIGVTANDRSILRDVGFSIERRARLAVVGPSGAGKTTLLRVLAGLCLPSEGTLALAGQQVNAPGRRAIAPERRDVSMVFQGLALFPHLRVLEQIEFAVPRQTRHAERKRLATDLLSRVQLGNRARARLDELSGGERQRVALARALAQRPAILLMDEPFAALDDLTRADMRELLTSLLADTPTTLVLVTHHRDDAFALADHVLVLDQGQCVDGGEMSKVIGEPRHRATVATLGLGDLLPAVLTSEHTALTPIGEVRLGGRLPTSGPGAKLQLLLRPGQLTASRCFDNGDGHPDALPPNARIISVRHALPQAGDLGGNRVVRCALLESPGEQILHARMLANGRVPTVGERVRLSAIGPCQTLGNQP